MNQKKSLISILFLISMIFNLAVMPAYAGKPTADMDVTIQPSDPGYYEITFTNTGGIRISIINIRIDQGAEDWGQGSAGGGWELTSFTAIDAIYQASGKYVLGRGDSVTFQFKAGSTPFQCHWSTGNRKSVQNSGAFWYPSPPI